MGRLHGIGLTLLIILLTEVRHTLYVMYFVTVSLWLSPLAMCQTFNYVGSGEYLSLTVNPIVAEQMYTTSELCRWHQRIFINQFSNFTQLKSEFTLLHLLKFLRKSNNFPRRYRKNGNLPVDSYLQIRRRNSSWRTLWFTISNTFRRQLIDRAIPHRKPSTKKAQRQLLAAASDSHNQGLYRQLNGVS